MTLFSLRSNLLPVLGQVLVLALTVAAGFQIASQGDGRDTKARTRVLIFLSMNCACSNDQLLELADLVRSYQPRGFEFSFHGLNDDASPAERVAYEGALGVGLPFSWDGARELAERYRVDRTPLALVLSASGSEFYRGGIRAPDESPLLVAALADLSAGRPVRQPLGKSIGCALRLTYAPTSNSQ